MAPKSATTGRPGIMSLADDLSERTTTSGAGTAEPSPSLPRGEAPKPALLSPLSAAASSGSDGGDAAAAGDEVRRLRDRLLRDRVAAFRTNAAEDPPRIATTTDSDDAEEESLVKERIALNRSRVEEPEDGDRAQREAVTRVSVSRVLRYKAIGRVALTGADPTRDGSSHCLASRCSGEGGGEDNGEGEAKVEEAERRVERDEVRERLMRLEADLEDMRGRNAQLERDKEGMGVALKVMLEREARHRHRHRALKSKVKDLETELERSEEALRRSRSRSEEPEAKEKARAEDANKCKCAALEEQLRRRDDELRRFQERISELEGREKARPAEAEAEATERLATERAESTNKPKDASEQGRDSDGARREGGGQTVPEIEFEDGARMEMELKDAKRRARKLARQKRGLESSVKELLETLRRSQEWIDELQLQGTDKATRSPRDEDGNRWIDELQLQGKDKAARGRDPRDGDGSRSDNVECAALEERLAEKDRELRQSQEWISRLIEDRARSQQRISELEDAHGEKARAEATERSAAAAARAVHEATTTKDEAERGRELDGTSSPPRPHRSESGRGRICSRWEAFGQRRQLERRMSAPSSFNPSGSSPVRGRSGDSDGADDDGGEDRRAGPGERSSDTSVSSVSSGEEDDELDALYDVFLGQPPLDNKAAALGIQKGVLAIGAMTSG